jgi:16S rRNA (guanine527-N7)-methyltransferase
MSDSVSRETPPAPEEAVGVFSHTLPLAEKYADLLAREGVLRGLIGPREVPRLWDRHLINCALLGRAIGEGLDVCDIGSGAGLPGLVLAVSRPDLQVAYLDLPNVEVLRARAEELHGKREFSVVTSRAVAPLERLLGWSMPLVRQGGELVAMKGSSVGEEITAAEKTLEKYGAGRVTVEEHGADLVERPTIVVRVEATVPSGLGWGTHGEPRVRGRKKRGAKSRSRQRRDR